MPGCFSQETSWHCVSCFQNFRSLKCLKNRQVYWKEKKNIEVCNYSNGATQSWEKTSSRRVKEKGRNGVHKFWPGYCVAFRLYKNIFSVKAVLTFVLPVWARNVFHAGYFHAVTIIVRGILLVMWSHGILGLQQELPSCIPALNHPLTLPHLVKHSWITSIITATLPMIMKPAHLPDLNASVTRLSHVTSNGTSKKLLVINW